MRPGGFSPRSALGRLNTADHRDASMRPGGFSPRSGLTRSATGFSRRSGFNEAGGILPPECRLPLRQDDGEIGASMRPGGFSPRSGVRRRRRPGLLMSGFNEAGGILPPEWCSCSASSRQISARRFNEAGGILPPECAERRALCDRRRAASMRPGGFSPRSGRALGDALRAAAGASMRPGGFSPRSGKVHPPDAHQFLASMRPGGFSPRSAYGAVFARG